MHRDTFLKALCFSQIVWAALSSSGAEPYGLDARAPIERFLNDRMPPVRPEGQWAVVKAFPDHTFPDPIGFTLAPGTTRFYVYCREGQIYFFDSAANTTNQTLFLDISARTQSWDDCGLLGMAFHPQFGQPASTNRGYVYVFYQYSATPTPGPGRPPRTTPSYNRLSRFTVPDNSSVADPNSELVLIDQYDEDVWHNGGSMFFNPDDGFLYLSLGDEGGFDAQYGNTQLINKALFSGVIRIDVDSDPSRSHPIRRQPQTEGTQPPSRTSHYYIPNDNPFLDPAGSVLEEFYCIGLRSPHRMSYDPVAKQVWLGDVGSVFHEEIDLIEKGGNYQWGYKEGTLAGPIPKPANIIGTEKPPIYEYGRADGDLTVIGGYVYRGSAYAAELGGKYIFGDNSSGRIWALTINPAGPPTLSYLCNMPAGGGYNGLASFGVDHNGEIYLVQMGPYGQIYKLVRPGQNIAPPPALLSQTGAFSDLQNMVPTAGLIPYEVNSPLWSDGAIKTRWMALPNDGAPYSTNEQIAFAPTDEWSFPDGTVFVKHFELAINETNASVRKRLETRLLMRDTNGSVYGLTYKWRPDQSEADLLDGALTEEITVQLAAQIGAFSSLDIGGPMPGSTSFDPATGFYTITASGADIWDAADQFRFVYQQRTGDFDVKVRAESLTFVEPYTKAGLMARESLAANSRHVNANIYADNRQRGNVVTGYEFIYRALTGGASGSVDPPVPNPQVNYPDTWLRLKRQGDEFTAYASTNGISWTRYATYALALPSTVYFGMVVTSHDNTQTTTAKFGDLANNRGHSHYYPSRLDCITCHTPAAKHILGVKAPQLNGLYTYPGTAVTDNQLRTWNHLGLLNPALDEADIPALPKLVAVTNNAASLEERVRSYLAANCSQCHRPGGVTRANFDARYETSLLLQNIINGPVNEPFGVIGAHVVSPGNLSRSILYRRMSSVDDTKMPPLARNIIDRDAVTTFAQWISSLPPTGNNFGLHSEYYDNLDLTNLKLTRADEVIDFDWGLGSPDPAIGPETFSVRWTGLLQPRFSELYSFYTTSDDGVRLWVNGQLIINNWTDHPVTEDVGTIMLMAGQKYDLRMEYFENGGDAVARLAWSSPSQPKGLVPPSQFSPPVGEWLDRDIGGVGIAGLATFTNRNVAISASGADIWDYADAFHFVYRPLIGDGQIVARVASLQNSDAWAKAGVMIRESLDADSTHAFTAITSGNGAAFQRRTIQGGLSSHTAGPAVSAPYWVKLVRNGNNFSGSISSDKVNWLAIGTEVVPMGTGAFIGLAVTAHNNAMLNKASFTEVDVTLSSFPIPAIRSIERLDSTRVRLQITGTNSASYAVQACSNLKDWLTVTTLAGSDGTMQFIDTQATNKTSRFYRLVGAP